MSETAVEATATEVPEAVTPQEAPESAPKPTDTVEFWQQKAREQEKRAKSNADAAKRLQEIEDSQKSEAQRSAEAAAQAQRDVQEARSAASRYKAAATHRLSEDMFDLLGTGSEEEILDRAQRLGSVVSERDALKTENESLKAELEALKGRPGQGRPVENLRPGATPVEVDLSDDAYPASWIPKRRNSA